MPTSITIAIALAAALWLAGIAACVVALKWSRACRGRRFTGALLLGAGALAIGYLGYTRFELTYAKTVNGQGWSVSSKWFFLALILLATVSLLVVCWNRFRVSRNAETGHPPNLRV